MHNKTYSLALILMGIIFLLRPGVLRIGIRRKTVKLVNLPESRRFNLYVRIWGGLLILAGLYLVILYY